MTPVLDQLDMAAAFATRTIQQQTATLRTSVATWEPAPCPERTTSRAVRPVRRAPEQKWWRT
jgi:hypothetical protein